MGIANVSPGGGVAVPVGSAGASANGASDTSTYMATAKSSYPTWSAQQLATSMQQNSQQWEMNRQSRQTAPTNRQRVRATQPDVRQDISPMPRQLNTQLFGREFDLFGSMNVFNLPRKSKARRGR
jgi:hypothetical protein